MREGWRFLVAVLLALMLWLLVTQGAGAQPAGSLGQCPPPAAVRFDHASLVGSAIVKKHATYDQGGIEFFDLFFGAPTGNAVLSVDGKSEIARWLTRQQGTRVSMELK